MVSTDKAYLDAVVTRLNTLTVFVGEAPDKPDTQVPFAVLYPSAVAGHNGTLGDSSTQHRFDIQVTSVGSTAEQALWMSGKIRERLNGWTPTISGRSSWPVRQMLNTPFARRDDLVIPPLYVAISQWRIQTQPS